MTDPYDIAYGKLRRLGDTVKGQIGGDVRWALLIFEAGNERRAGWIHDLTNEEQLVKALEELCQHIRNRPGFKQERLH